MTRLEITNVCFVDWGVILPMGDERPDQIPCCVEPDMSISQIKDLALFSIFPWPDSDVVLRNLNLNLPIVWIRIFRRHLGKTVIRDLSENSCQRPSFENFRYILVKFLQCDCEEQALKYGCQLLDVILNLQSMTDTFASLQYHQVKITGVSNVGLPH